jgi:hypothetical protein
MGAQREAIGCVPTNVTSLFGGCEEKYPLYHTTSVGYLEVCGLRPEKSLRGARLKLFPSAVTLEVKEWKGPTPSTYSTETGIEV